MVGNVADVAGTVEDVADRTWYLKAADVGSVTILAMCAHCHYE